MRWRVAWRRRCAGRDQNRQSVFLGGLDYRALWAASQFARRSFFWVQALFM